MLDGATCGDRGDGEELECADLLYEQLMYVGLPKTRVLPRTPSPRRRNAR